jgi:hypothetical protein
VTFTVTVSPTTLGVLGYRFLPGDGSAAQPPDVGTEQKFNNETSTTVTFSHQYNIAGTWTPEVKVKALINLSEKQFTKTTSITVTP